VVAVGEQTKVMAEVVKHPGTSWTWCSHAVEAAEVVNSLIEAGDVVLVKGSRGVGLERVVQAMESKALADALRVAFPVPERCALVEFSQCTSVHSFSGDRSNDHCDVV
jgi:hypothetical protein